MPTVKDTTIYEELDAVGVHDLSEENPCQHSYVPFFRQLLLCSTLWTLYFLYGLQMGTPTVMIPQLRKDANLSTEIDDELGSWITSMFPIGALPWVFLVPAISDYAGKKRTFIFINFWVFIGFLVIFLSSSVKQLLVGELILGILLGCLQTIAAVTISEYTSPKYRGFFMTIKSASGFWGMWVSNVIGTFWHWKIIVIVAFICNAYTLTVFAWPESPYWLARKGRYTECAKAYRWLRGTSSDANAELHKLISSHKSQHQNHIDQRSVLSKKYLDSMLKTASCTTFYKPLFIVQLVAFQYYFSGKLVCSMYAIEILKKITSSTPMAYKGMLILDGITVFSAYCGCILSKYVKRRPFLLSTTGVGIIFLYGLSLYLYLINKSLIIENSFVTISLLAFFSITITGGPMILSSTVYGELISVRYQRSTTIILGAVSAVIMIVTIKFAPLLFRTVTLSGAFLLYAIFSTVTIVLVHIYLPETKDKTLQEIEEYFKGTSKLKENTTSLI